MISGRCVRRLAGALLAGLCALVGASAGASTTTYSYFARSANSVPAPPYASTGQGVCDGYYGAGNAQAMFNNSQCYYKGVGSSTFNSGGIAIYKGTQTCTDPMTLDTSQSPPVCAGPKCTAGAGTDFWGTSSVPAGTAPGTIVGGFPTSDGVCMVIVDSVGSCGVYGTTQECHFYGHMTGLPSTSDPNWTGQSSTTPAGTPTPSNLPPTKSPNGCPGGTVSGGVSSDGMQVCIGSGTTPTPSTTTTTTGPTTSTTNPDGSTTTTQTQTTNNRDGSTTTTTTNTTVTTGGTIKITQSSSTSAAAGGGAGSADSPVSGGSSGGSGGSGGSSGGSSSGSTPNPDQANLCKTNPNLNICKNSSVSGTCGQTACSGDAIQCATLRAAAAMQCKQQQQEDDAKASTAYSLGSAAASGSDPLGSTLPSPAKADTVTLATPDNSGWLGGGSYFQDKSIPMPGGGTLVLPLSKGADVLIALRYVTMIVSGLVCFSIVRSSFSSGV